MNFLMQWGLCMRVLVIGGAGYIGSHVVRLLDKLGYDVLAYDNLSTGHAQSVKSEQLIVGELSDCVFLKRVFMRWRIDAVIHLAANACVGESVTHPAKYYKNNVSNTLGLLDLMRNCGVWKLVFSSTTATYGNPEHLPISESALQLPVNPYGFTKLVIERALKDYASAYGFAGASLRYFNAAGASSDGSIGEDHNPETHLIPTALNVALGKREFVEVFGGDYNTRDGSAIRDYVHVEDLADSHVSALEKLKSGQVLEVNLGTEIGTSVLEVVEACRKITGHAIPVVMSARRPGDSAKLVSDCSLAREVLGWNPKCWAIDDIVRTAWNWHKSNPNGY